MAKIGCVHTGAGASIFGLMESELKKRIQGPCEIMHITDPSIISRISKNREIGREDVTELLRMYNLCADRGCDIILNMCSSVGELADAARPLFEKAGIQIVRIDHQMCVEAAAAYRRIAVVATLNSTMHPSCALLERCAQEQGRQIELLPVLIDGAFGLDKDALTAQIENHLQPVLACIDAVVLAQNSMTQSAEPLSVKIQKPVLASPAFAATEVAALVNNRNI